jgi:nicotinate-nucleotide pyrophosphorylase (carboxylating)
MTLHPSVAERLLAAGIEPDDTERAVLNALREDFRYGPDVTSVATVPPGTRTVADIVAREPGVVAGLPVALAVIDAAGVPSAVAEPLCADGDRVDTGSAVLRIRAPLRELLWGRADPAQLPHASVGDRHHDESLRRRRGWHWRGAT